MQRLAIDKLLEELERRNVVFAILPTGYGKSHLVVHNPWLLDRFGRFVHVLPLRALVQQLVERAREKIGEVSYQAGMVLSDIVKTPFLSGRYVVSTIDSFSLNFFGIPVAELWRTYWHSDVAYLLARTANIVLDEVHLVVNPDAGDGDGVEFEEIAKVVEFVRRIASWCRRYGTKLVIVSATMCPSMVKTIATGIDDYSVVVYAPPNHRYVEKLKKDLGNDRIVAVWNDEWLSNASKLCIDLEIVEDEDLIHVVKRELEEAWHSLAVFLNSARRAVELYQSLRRYVAGKDIDLFLLHGRMPRDTRSSLVASMLRSMESGRKVILVATQIVEAGIDVSFDVAITEIASPLSIVQRCGRVARYFEKRGKFVVVAKDLEEMVRGIYDPESVSRGLEVLKSIASYGRCNGNRLRVPHIDGDDYLTLLLSIDDLVENRLQRFVPEVSRRLSVLENIVGTSRVALRILDDLGGSIVRRTSLLSIVPRERIANYVGTDTDSSCSDYLDQHVANTILESVVEVDTVFIERYGNRVLEVPLKVVYLYEDGNGVRLCVSRTSINDVSKLRRKPLTSLRRVLREVVASMGMELDESSEHATSRNVSLVGFLSKNHAFVELGEVQGIEIVSLRWWS